MSDATQDGPALDQNVASEKERLDGLVEQVRADVAGEDAAIVEQALRRRLTDTGIEVDDERVRVLVQEISG